MRDSREHSEDVLGGDTKRDHASAGADEVMAETEPSEDRSAIKDDLRCEEDLRKALEQLERAADELEAARASREARSGSARTRVPQ